MRSENNPWRPNKAEWLNGPPDGSALICPLVPTEKPKSSIDARLVDHREIYPVEKPVSTSGGEPVPSAEYIPGKTQRKGEWGVMFNVNFPEFKQKVDFPLIQVGGKSLPKQDVVAEPESGPVWVPWNSPYHPIEVRPRRAWAHVQGLNGEMRKIEIKAPRFRYWPPPLPGQKVDPKYRRKAYARAVDYPYGRIERASLPLPVEQPAPPRPGTHVSERTTQKGIKGRFELVRLPPVPYTFKAGIWEGPNGQILPYPDQTVMGTFEPVKVFVPEHAQFLPLSIPQPEKLKATITVPNLNDPDHAYLLPKIVTLSTKPPLYQFQYAPLPQPGWPPIEDRIWRWIARPGNAEYRTLAYRGKDGKLITNVVPRDREWPNVDQPIRQSFKYPNLHDDIKSIPKDAIRPHPGPAHWNRRNRKFGIEGHSRFARIAMMNAHEKRLAKDGRGYKVSADQMAPLERKVGKSTFYMGDIGAGAERSSQVPPSSEVSRETGRFSQVAPSADIWQEARDIYSNEEAPTDPGDNIPNDVGNLADFEDPEGGATGSEQRTGLVRAPIRQSDRSARSKIPKNGRQATDVTVEEATKRIPDDSRACVRRKSKSGPHSFKSMPTIAEELDEEAFSARCGGARPKTPRGNRRGGN